MCADATNAAALVGCSTTRQRVFFAMLNLANQTNARQANLQAAGVLQNLAASNSMLEAPTAPPATANTIPHDGNTETALGRSVLPTPGARPAGEAPALPGGQKLLRNGIVAELVSADCDGTAAVSLVLVSNT
ncbi:MAG: hypothetical protein WDW38_004170 [Sanguina aurantia]